MKKILIIMAMACTIGFGVILAKKKKDASTDGTL
jgi:hypothetical protein